MLSLPLAGGDKPVAPEPPPPLKIVTLEFPPLEFLNEKKEVDGAATKIVRELFQSIGRSIEIELLPFTRALALVKEGKADGIFTVYRNAEREGFLEFSTEILVPQVVSLYVPKASILGFRTFEDLREKTIGTVSSISYGEIFDKVRETKTFKTERVESLELNFRKLLAGRIDYVISNRYSAQVVIDQEKLADGVRELANPVEVIPSYFAFAKNKANTDLRDHFDKELRRLKLSGRYHEILKEYKVRIPTEIASGK